MRTWGVSPFFYFLISENYINKLHNISYMAEDLSIMDYVILFNNEQRTEEQLKKALESFSKEDLIKYITKTITEDMNIEDLDDDGAGDSAEFFNE